MFTVRETTKTPEVFNLIAFCFKKNKKSPSKFYNVLFLSDLKNRQKNHISTFIVQYLNFVMRKSK
ncbi:MAG: hypothetical protein CVU09_15110 [Bacteroidetes bacterium HGW-Bacteroidetes-4]|nr:MAG: hypothetical protein CVU09_15110 [Bacteroidetes bacterium HGW-Bacteroidetes-4]